MGVGTIEKLEPLFIYGWDRTKATYIQAMKLLIAVKMWGPHVVGLVQKQLRNGVVE